MNNNPQHEALAQDLYILGEMVKNIAKVQVLIVIPTDLEHHLRDMNININNDSYGLYALYGNNNGRIALKNLIDHVEDKADDLIYDTANERRRTIRELVKMIMRTSLNFDAIYVPPVNFFQMRRSPKKSVKRSRKAKKSVKRSVRKTRK